MNESPPGILLCDDLLFISRITGVARDLGLSIRSVRTSADLLAQAALQAPVCVVLDLHNATLQINEVVPPLKESSERPCLVIGFGSHVDTATLKRAREAGCDLVLPRSKFVEELPTALPRWFTGSP